MNSEKTAEKWPKMTIQNQETGKNSLIKERKCREMVDVAVFYAELFALLQK